MAGAQVDAETPYIEVNLDTDPLQADRQLQLALHLNASRTDLSPAHSRKHSRSSSYDESDYCSSDISGQFDDADEIDSPDRYQGTNNNTPSSHSAKRRRSNDWKSSSRGQQKTATDDEGSNSQTESGHRWRIYPHSNHGRKTSYNGSPRASAGSCRTGRPGAGARPRRSRFVEAKMNDSVSERPPSIFLRDDANATVGHRNSGIFRFGKAIASAFNPFGVWGNVSDIWKGQDTNNRDENDPLARAEKAYAELKKAGYKGTVKGSYMANNQLQESLPDQTWKAIQEKMDYKPSGRHSRQGSGESQSSLLSSFQDLRKAKSSLGFHSSARRDVSSPSPIVPYSDRPSEDSEFPEMRKQKSRRDMLRQAKLLKKVSNLEDKLTKARRELREMGGQHDGAPSQPPRTLCLEQKPYPKKFVPGALPTLPSERLLEEQMISPIEPEPEPESEFEPDMEPEPVPLGEVSENILRITASSGNDSDDLPVKKQAPSAKSPKQLKESKASSLAPDSPSLKRKSPDPESLSKAQTDYANPDDEGGRPSSSGQNGKSRIAKLPKMGASDSPGSVERKRSHDRLWAEYNELSSPGKSQYLKPPSSRSPSSSPRRASANGTPCLRMKKGRNDLRSASVGFSSPNIVEHQDEAQRTFYMQQEHDIDPDQPVSSRASPSPNPRRRDHNQDDIPPVPPLPKDLAATAAKVDRRLAKEISKRKQTHQRKLKTTSNQQTQVVDDSFQWPDDIF